MVNMFKFNFNNTEECSRGELCNAQNTTEWYESKEIKVPSDILNFINSISKDQITKIDYDNDIKFCCLSSKKVLKELKDKSNNENFLDALAADKQHLDLLPGKYEGGLKTWECTKDLAVYFMRHVIGETNNLNDKQVLDLGCGTGMLGIMCLLQGATVTFQDYNQEVLEAMTIPNIFLNCQDSVRNKIQLFCGDWFSFLQLIISKSDRKNFNTIKYDYILTSETIYNPENYKKIIKLIKNLLKENGIALVAAKTHYFGVGGNLREFESLVEQEGLHCSTCWETTEGVSRGILEIKLQ